MRSLFRSLVTLLCSLTFILGSPAQRLEKSGVQGIDLVYATSPTGTSRLFATAVLLSPTPIPVGDMVTAVPSRWAHRRRTLGALETKMEYLEVGAVVCPMGDAVGNGALHFVDFRLGLDPVSNQLVATQNPAAYDLAVMPGLQCVFSAEDDGVAGTRLRGYSYATPGTLAPLSTPVLTLPGRPSAYCNRIGVDESAGELHIPTRDGIQIVSISAGTMVLGPFVSTAPRSPTTNPASFDRNGKTTWIVGTGEFVNSDDAVDGGFLAWDDTGISESGTFGVIPNLAPPRNYVPAAGTHELAIVGDGVNTWVYYLLRDPSPTAFFIRPSAVGVIRFLGSDSASIGTIPCPESMGEPFAIPTVNGTRVAIESSMGPPFTNMPSGGGEVISILYSPLDPLGASTMDGMLAVPDPLGGRISTKGMDRPLWSRDGTSVVGATSHFPGAPNPGVPGIEVLNVPELIPVDQYTGPHLVVPNLVSPNRSIIFPTAYDPRDSSPMFALGGLSFVGNVFPDGMASILAGPFGEIGQFQPESVALVQDPDVPNFPAILPPSFEDASGSLEAVPDHFGARRTTFNLIPGLGLDGLVLSAAIDGEILIQATGYNFRANLGAHPSEFETVRMQLPTGWVTTTEFLSR